jgi:uncharacterized protein (TIGR02284 family)
MDRNDVISTLNDLIETSKDGEQGFRTCADAVTSPRLKQLLETAAERCTQGALELQNKVRSLGGDPERSGSASGALHRGWVNIKSVVTGTNEAAVLNECERGEDVAKQVYGDAQKGPADGRALDGRAAIPRCAGEPRSGEGDAEFAGAFIGRNADAASA